MGLNGRDGKTGDHLQVFIFKKNQKRGRTGDFLTEAGKEPPPCYPLHLQVSIGNHGEEVKIID